MVAEALAVVVLVAAEAASAADAGGKHDRDAKKTSVFCAPVTKLGSRKGCLLLFMCKNGGRRYPETQRTIYNIMYGYKFIYVYTRI